MEVMIHRKRTALYWALGIVAALLALGGAIVYDLHRRADEVIARHEREVAADIAALRAKDPSRPVLFGEPVEGNAWDLYKTALDAFGAIPDTETKELPSFNNDPTFVPDPAKIGAIVEKSRWDIERVRAALCMTTVEPAYRYEEGPVMELPYVAKSIRASKFLSDAAFCAETQGRNSKSLDRLLLILGMAEDTARKGVLVNELVRVVNEAIAFLRMKEILASHAWSSGDLERAARILDRLFAERPKFEEVMAVEWIFNRITTLMIVHGIEISLGGSIPSSLRYLFSKNMMAAGALRDFEAFQECVHDVSRRPGHERERLSQDAIGTILKSGNPITLLMLPSLSKAWRNVIGNETEWQLARISIALARHEAETGGYPDTLKDLVPKYLETIPDDPTTGKPFVYIQQGGRATVYGFGGDKNDDGGRPVPEGDYEADGDVVWRIQRRP